MSYTHYLNLSATLKPDVKQVDVLKALTTLANECFLEDLFSTGEDSLEWHVNENGHAQGFTLYTYGHVPDNHRALVYDVADRLADYVEPTYVKHVNLDDASDDACAVIWIGSGPELELAQREYAIEHVREQLQATIVDEAYLESLIEQIRFAPLPSETSTRVEHSRPTHGA